MKNRPMYAFYLLYCIGSGCAVGLATRSSAAIFVPAMFALSIFNGLLGAWLLRGNR